MRLAIAAAALAALTAVAAQAAPAAPAPSAATDFSRYQTIDDISAFEVLAPIQGLDTPRPIAVAPPAERSISDAAIAQAQAYSDARDGKALLIWQGGKLQYAAYAPALGPTTPFNVFSMTKSVLGLVYGAALRDGVIGSLDDPAGRYIAEWRDDARGSITLRQLLTMSSGLRLASLAKPDARTVDMIFGRGTTKLSLEEPAAESPGRTFEYNNIDSQIAGVALDRALRATGQGGYVEYLSEMLWRPVGNGDARTWLEHAGGQPRYYTGLMATAPDWLRLGLLVKDHGRVGDRQILPAAWIDEITAPSATNPNYGIQIWMGQPFRKVVPAGPTRPEGVTASEAYIAPDLIYFNGAQGQRVYISRALDLVIVRIGRQGEAWDNAAIPNAVARGLRR